MLNGECSMYGAFPVFVLRTGLDIAGQEKRQFMTALLCWPDML